MKKMLSLFSAIMIRPTIYRAVTKCAVMLTVVLLWDRYVNKGLLPVGRDGCFVAALFLFGLAWLNYLRLDGLEVPHLLSRGKKKEKKRRRLTGILRTSRTSISCPLTSCPRRSSWPAPWPPICPAA